MSKGGGPAAPPEGWTEIKSWRKEDSVETEDGLCGSIDIPTPLRSTDINRAVDFAWGIPPPAVRIVCYTASGEARYLNVAKTGTVNPPAGVKLPNLAGRTVHLLPPQEAKRTSIDPSTPPSKLEGVSRTASATSIRVTWTNPLNKMKLPARVKDRMEIDVEVKSAHGGSWVAAKVSQNMITNSESPRIQITALALEPSTFHELRIRYALRDEMGEVAETAPWTFTDATRTRDLSETARQKRMAAAPAVVATTQKRQKKKKTTSSTKGAKPAFGPTAGAAAAAVEDEDEDVEEEDAMVVDIDPMAAVPVVVAATATALAAPAAAQAPASATGMGGGAKSFAIEQQGCYYCFSKPPDMVYSCGHLVACSGCIATEAKKCPEIQFTCSICRLNDDDGKRSIRQLKPDTVHHLITFSDQCKQMGCTNKRDALSSCGCVFFCMSCTEGASRCPNPKCRKVFDGAPQRLFFPVPTGP